MTTNAICARDFYHNINLGGKSLYMYIGDITAIESIGLHLCWAACHISFSFVQLKGAHTDKNDRLQHRLFINYDSRILTMLDGAFEMHIFHFMAGRYGHLTVDRSYKYKTAQILHCLETESQVMFIFGPEHEKDLFPFPSADGFVQI